MLNRIFPEQFDNHYRGHKFALWLFYPITFLNMAIALAAIFASDGGAQSADGIPLDTFGASAAATVIGIVAFLGISELLLGLLFVLVLFRYRAMIALMYLLIVVHDLAHKGIGLFKPIVHLGTSSASLVNAVFLVLGIIGLVLSLQGKDYLARQESGSA